jgi:hypothetical protein
VYIEARTEQEVEELHVAAQGLVTSLTEDGDRGRPAEDGQTQP